MGKNTVSPAKNVGTPHTKDEGRLIYMGLRQEMLRRYLKRLEFTRPKGG
ncbi:hypothetical protein [Bacillus sp. ISL-57]|nr:hypothetical protein [Bacillus sp. ISL-57]